MSVLQPLDPSAGAEPRDATEKECFFGTGMVLDYYREAWDYRPGEKFVFDHYLGSGGRLLDMGCGTGRTSFLLADRFDAIDAFSSVSLVPSILSRL